MAKPVNSIPVPLIAQRDAVQLRFWQFDANQNRLTFATNGAVQPKAKLIFNPTRLVIDLPGVQVGAVPLQQTIAGTIQTVRVAQFNPQTARIVVEVAPGYTLDPQGIQVRGSSPQNWSVQLPTPQAVPQEEPTPSPLPRSTKAEQPGFPGSPTAQPELQQVTVTAEGLWLQLVNGTPSVQVDRDAGGQQIQVTLAGTILAPSLQPDVLIGRYGISRIRIEQVQSSPPVTQLTLNVSEKSPNWQAGITNGGILLSPIGGVQATAAAQRDLISGRSSSIALNQVVTIESVGLTTDGKQLLIRADGRLRYETGWDRSSGAYRIEIPSARLRDGLTSLRFSGNQSPLSEVRMIQQDDQTVVLLIQPVLTTRIGSLSQPNAQTLALDLYQSGQRPSIATSPRPNPTPTPTPTPRPTPRPTPTPPPIRPTKRVVVVIDPGHGGPDPGAIGIGGLREKDIVFPISLDVAAILQQQGIQVVLTRQDDRDLGLEPRVQITRDSRANLFVSIHANAISMSRPDVNGVETYYHSSNSLKLAQAIQSRLLEATGMRNRGVKRARFYVIRRNVVPSVLVEVGFVTGAEDAPRLADPAFRSQIAGAIAQGILDYLQ